MRKIILSLSFLVSVCACNVTNKDIQETDYTQYVDPFVGTADNGHTFPGACAPFGMIQTTPQTGNGAWQYCSGYNDADSTIQGFVQSCLNGTGVPDLGDILMLPFVGDITDQLYKSSFEKASEKASPGYYGVTLKDFNIDAELTASQHVAFHCYTFNSDKEARLFIDFTSGLWDKPDTSPQPRTIKKSIVNWESNYSITGHNTVKAWVERQVFYAIEFDKPYKVLNKTDENDKNASKCTLGFDLKKGESVQVKIALSTVSIEGAKNNLEKEKTDWDFKQLTADTKAAWNTVLSKIDIEGSQDEKKNFYTSMYHLYIQPNNIADVDGKYRGINDSIYASKSGKYYSTLSLWDTYRAAHPLYTILSPNRVGDMVQSMLDHYKIKGYLPIWTVWGKENYCMIGNHAIPVVADAYLKGIEGFDREEAYKAVKASSTVSHRKSDWEVYNQYGYYPFDLVKEESVSRTLESAYDDYCVAQMAKSLNKTEDYEYFVKRSNFYKNLFDPETKLVRGKDSKGQWRTPFNTFHLSHAGSAGGDYTEGNAWQYTWHVQHDPEALIELMGSKEYFVTKLDSLFFLDTRAESTGFVSDVTGFIGQYAHGNEPSHHVAYLYSYADRKDKTQELIREIFDRFYLPKADGLCGNDDCGQMSAWYIFSAMGFYPVNPCGGEYVLGAPQLPQATINLSNGKKFRMQAENLSKENKYVQDVKLNGKPLQGFTINHMDIMNGGELIFTMTDTPLF